MARSRVFSRHAARKLSASSPPRIACAATSAATRSQYVVTRNIQYTNVCYFRCGFCAFSKGKLAANLRGAAVPRPARRDRASRSGRRGSAARRRGVPAGWDRSGVHRRLLRRTSCARFARPVPDIHVHAFSALEVWQGAATSSSRSPSTSRTCASWGSGRCPGPLRRSSTTRCAGSSARQGDDGAVARRARRGPSRPGCARTSRSCSDTWSHRARGRALSCAPASSRLAPAASPSSFRFPFVQMEAPIYLKGRARRGPTFREALLVHAVARPALHPGITNIQASWVKLGPDGTRQALAAGVNDLGGTLMNESISRSAGAAFGQEMPPERMEEADPFQRALPAAADDALCGRSRGARACFFRGRPARRADEPARAGRGPRRSVAPRPPGPTGRGRRTVGAAGRPAGGVGSSRARRGVRRRRPPRRSPRRGPRGPGPDRARRAASAA